MFFFSRVLPMGPLIWQAVLDICRPRFLPFQRLMHGLTATGGRLPYHDEAHPQSSYTDTQHHVITTKHRPIIQQSNNQKLIMIGIFAEVYLVDGTIIRKAPRSGSEEDLQPIIREATIYNLLDDHPRIAQCTSRGRMDYIDIKYYSHGDLASFCQTNEVTPELKSKLFQQLIEAVAVIHSYDIIHSDLALRQFFVDNDFNIRLGDFNSSQYPGHPALGYEKATHCLPRDYELPNTVLSDLFALGSTLYELLTGKPPYSNLYPVESEDTVRSGDPDVIRARFQREHLANLEVEQRYKNHEFPDVCHLFRGDIILGLWNGKITSAAEAVTLSTHSPY
ncbi:kinase-like protein [Aspergillus sclerotioniger CBS 115572]|uniref:Kinase-like protein n=1 Tax=Aspergillus sclerotioniger CBS 115572 TaxID=1450535 RepID=A0A317VQ62_9EURO|nr:kinase-like protein [Aspergillus sclerotioniger CBS 115572]PWY76075.1 kinase-like protein [Aspergillus sclerotioniger CBS 115572]